MSALKGTILDTANLNKNLEFDDDLFETRLEALKDTQEGIQQMSAWCLENRSFHKKIVQSWLNAFKKTRVEQRLVLFYLANDVIQNSKRKKYEFVEGWATALQRATTMVRDEKVKNKILRIFKIWGDRDIYNEDYLSDLRGLLNMNPPKKSIEPAELSSDEFSNNKLIAYVRDCVQNADATDRSLKKMPKMPYADTEALKQMIKDKSHTEDVEKDLDRYITYMKVYYKNLQTELVSRRTLLNELAKARKFYRSQFGEVKVVAAAYKNFGLRIKILQKKLNEITPNLPSPIPSPDINAPSPEPDADLQLPDEQPIPTNFFKNSMNGYSSYLDGNLPFDINDFKEELGQVTSRTPSQPIEVIGARSDDESYSSGSHTTIDYYKPTPISSYSSNTNVQIPGLNSSIPSIVQPIQSEYTSLARSSAQYGNILPPPPNAPVFDGSAYTSLMSAYSTEGSYLSNNAPVAVNSTNNNNASSNQSHAPPPPIPPSPLNSSIDGTSPQNWNMPWTPTNASASTNAYNPNLSMIETPESPASRYDRDALTATAAPIEYSERSDLLTQTNDVDHRQLHLAPFAIGAALGLSKDKTRQLDIDHRNLISLTGSPHTNEAEKKEWSASTTGDVDYRTGIVPALKTIETISTPSSNVSSTPSPSNIMPPPLTTSKILTSPQKSNTSSSSESQKDDGSIRYDPGDMVIDMDMSDEDLDDILREVESQQSQANDTIDYAQMISSAGKASDDTDTSELLAQLQSTDDNIESLIQPKPALLETPPEYSLGLPNVWDTTAAMNASGYPESPLPPPPPFPTPRMAFSSNQQQQQFQPFMRGGGNGGRGRGWSPHAMMHSPYRPRHMRGGGGGGPAFHGNGGRGGYGGGSPFFNRGGNNPGFRGRRGNAWI